MKTKLKLYKKSEAAEETNPKQLFVKLIKDEHDDLALVIVDKEGKEIPKGRVLVLDLDEGVVVKFDNVSGKSGLKRDLYGAVQSYAFWQLPKPPVNHFAIGIGDLMKKSEKSE